MTDAPETTIRQGDVFELLPSVETDSAHAAIVDYPWQFSAQNGTGRFGNDGSKGFDAFHTEPHDRLADVLEELSRCLVDGAWVFVFADDDTVPEFREHVVDSPLTYRRTLAWDREKFGMGTYHRVQHYPILAATNGDTQRYVRDRGTVFRAQAHDGNYPTRQYPTGKPVELYRQLLEPPVLQSGERLLEPFAGSAPGAAVASERGLSYWGADTNPEAVDHATDHHQQSRLSEAVGKGATSR
ncbi:hypothetical protein BRC97_07085 [Halobacteriales archaeon QS_6_71_20]|nr:MAG: hypothetical protein BRC97_07085 [Halobacteriales archaeon QS_6_71_20]